MLTTGYTRGKCDGIAATRRLALGLMLQTVSATLRSRLPRAFHFEAHLAPEPATQQLRLDPEGIVAEVDNEQAVEALERAHGFYMDVAIFEEGGTWRDTVPPALKVHICVRSVQIASQ